MTELRLAGVTTIDEANAVLHRFLPRFNEKFGVPAEHSSVAYRPMESSVSLGSDTLLQAPPQGGQGQHRQVQLAYLATAAW